MDGTDYKDRDSAPLVIVLLATRSGGYVMGRTPTGGWQLRLTSPPIGASAHCSQNRVRGDWVYVNHVPNELQHTQVMERDWEFGKALRKVRQG